MHDPERKPQTPTGEMILDWPAAFEFRPIEMEEDEIPDGAILIVRTHLPGDRTRLTMRPAVGVDWITARGLLEEALDHHRETVRGGDEADDDEDDYST